MQTQYNNRAFTLVELLVVCIIIAILIGILTPLAWFLVTASRETADRSQATRVQLAIDHYMTVYDRAPGFFHDTPDHPDFDSSGGAPDALTDETVYQNFTATENLVVSLMGGNTGENKKVTEMDARLVGNGPFDDGDFSGSYYAPQVGELGAATGTTGDDNDFPELMSISSGVPLLYFRATPKVGIGFEKYRQITWDQENKDRVGLMIRKPVFDYTNASNLMNKYNQQELSGLSMEAIYNTDNGNTGWDSHYNSWSGPNVTLAHFLVRTTDRTDRLSMMAWGDMHRGASNATNGNFDEGGYVKPKRYPGYEYLVVSPGADGIYFHRDHIEKTNKAHILYDSTFTGFGGTGKTSDYFGPEGVHPNSLYLAPARKVNSNDIPFWEPGTKGKGWTWATKEEKANDSKRRNWSTPYDIPFDNAREHLDDAWAHGGEPPIQTIQELR